MEFGKTIPLLPRRTFDFTGLSTSTSSIITLLRGLDACRYGTGVLIVRHHTNSLSGDRTLSLRLRSSAPDAEDPDIDFVEDSALAQVDLDANTGDDTLHTVALTPAFGPALHFDAVMTIGASAGDGGEIEVSAELLLRVGVPTPQREAADIAFALTGTTKRYLPFKGVDDGGSIGAPQTRLMAYPGRLEKVGVYASSAAGSTTIGFHRNGSTTAETSVTESISAGTLTEFEFSSDNHFDAGDRIHISYDPNASSGNVNCYYVVSYDRLW